MTTLKGRSPSSVPKGDQRAHGVALLEEEGAQGTLLAGISRPPFPPGHIGLKHRRAANARNAGPRGR